VTGPSGADASTSQAVFGSLIGERFGSAGKAGSLVRLTVPILSKRDDVAYASVAIDMNNDGAITPDEWLVLNMPVVATPASYGLFIEVPDTARDSAFVSVSLTSTPWDGVSRAAGADVTQDLVTFVAHDVPLPAPPPAPGIGGGGEAPASPYAPLFADPPAPVDKVLHAGVPSTQQGDDNGDDNTCVAHAVGSSLAWLSRTYGFSGAFKNGASWDGWQKDGGASTSPDAANQGVDGLTQDLLASYTNAKLYTRAGGVKPRDILPGKQSYVDANGLPVQTTRIPCDPNDSSGAGVYDGVKQALKAGCAVEMVLHFSGGAHIVQVVGYADDGKKRTLYIHDSQKAPFPGDPITDDAYTLSDDKLSLLRYPNPNTQVGGMTSPSILFAIQECPSGTAATAETANAVSCPLAADLITATFDDATFTTTYQVGILNSKNETVTTTWTGPNCNTWAPQDATTSKGHVNASMSWNHAGAANGGTCTHIGTDHTDATIVATVTNGTTTYTCSYVGSATGKGQPCVKN
jgi:hypothetical protein